MFSFAEITTRCKEYNWPQTANITNHKKLPLNEKAPCQTSSSSISITPFSFSVSTAFASYRSVTKRGLLWQFEHSVSISSACRQQRWVCTPLPQSLLHSVSFSRCVSSHRTVALLHIKQAKWGHAFIRQELWVYPSLSYIVEERRCCCTVAFWHSLSHGAIKFFSLFLFFCVLNHILNLIEKNFQRHTSNFYHRRENCSVLKLSPCTGHWFKYFKWHMCLCVILVWPFLVKYYKF